MVLVLVRGQVLDFPSLQGHPAGVAVRLEVCTLVARSGGPLRWPLTRSLSSLGR